MSKEDSLAVRGLNKSLQLHSLDDLVRVRRNAAPMLAVDVSGSMNTIMANGVQRIAGLREVVGRLQAEQSAPVLMIAFGGGGAFVVKAVPNPSGSTPLTAAIDLARSQGCGRLVVVSDGQPDDALGAKEAARRFGGRIDVVFVGDSGSLGELFLRDLAALTGGGEFTGDLQDPKQLAEQVAGLLEAGDVEDDDDDQ